MLTENTNLSEVLQDIATQNACGFSIYEKRSEVYVWCLFEQTALAANMLKDMGYYKFTFDKDSLDTIKTKFKAAMAAVRQKSKLTLSTQE